MPSWLYLGEKRPQLLDFLAREVYQNRVTFRLVDGGPAQLFGAKSGKYIQYSSTFDTFIW